MLFRSNDLFADSDATYYREALKVRYPDFLEEKDTYQIIDEKGHALKESIYPLMIAESYVKAFEEKYGGTYTVKVQEPIMMDV